MKHVFVFDDDVFDDAQMDWAMAVQFQAADSVPGIMGMPLDPSRNGPSPGTKAGFDMTLPPGAARRDIASRSARAPNLVGGQASCRTVREAKRGLLYFFDLVETVGSRDGREVAVALDEIRAAGELLRIRDGRYGIRKEPATTQTPPAERVAAWRKRRYRRRGQ